MAAIVADAVPAVLRAAMSAAAAGALASALLLRLRYRTELALSARALAARRGTRPRDALRRASWLHASWVAAGSAGWVLAVHAAVQIERAAPSTLAGAALAWAALAWSAWLVAVGAAGELATLPSGQRPRVAMRLLGMYVATALVAAGAAMVAR